MRFFVRRASALGGLIAALAIVGGNPVGAATIVQPAGVPTVVANAPITIVATGFAPGRAVYVEQCDGVAPRTQNWSPTLHCDLGTSPPPVVADASGEAAFRANVAGRALRPFAGESPQSLFNCTAPGVRPPANSLPSFTNCQVRVSTNNTDVTPDQVFFSLVLAAGAASSSTVGSVPSTAPSGSKGAPSTTSTTRHSGSKSSASRVGITPASSTDTAGSPAVAVVHAGTKSSGGVGLLALSDRGLGVGYLLVVVGVVVCIGPAFARRPRSARGRAPGSAPAESG